MNHWKSIRQRARAAYREITHSIGVDPTRLLPASQLIEVAGQVTGLCCQATRGNDGVLGGGYAVLYRDLDLIYYNAEETPQRQRFAIAHEFAHFWLHPEVEQDICQTDGNPDGTSGEGLSSAVGYSPDERRETEANVFAAELLLPSPALREAYCRQHLNALEIARLTGLSEACVLNQLANTLLYDDRSTPKDEDMEDGVSLHIQANPTVSENEKLQESAQEFIESLDQSQYQAATIENGPLLVDAGPGTGKTRTLIARIAWLLYARQTPPENILALTFSNRAAGEMMDRLRQTTGEMASRVWCSTFHTFGLELLRKYGGYANPPRLLEPAGAIALLERYIDRLDLNELDYPHDPTFAFADILDCISRAKDALKTHADYQEAAEKQWEEAGSEEERIAATKSLEVARTYAVYQEAMLAEGYVDFGDLLMRTVHLLETDADLLTTLQNRYRHILVDEYQDINRASARLIQLLAGGGTSLWAVGDLRQSIYGFLGAAHTNITEFEKDYPNGKRIQLLHNYRSRSPLVEYFSQVAKEELPSTHPEFSPWKAERTLDADVAITAAVAEDEKAQVDGMAGEMRKLVEAGYHFSQQAVLCRTNNQSARIAQELEERGVPTQFLGNLFEQPVVLDLLSLLSLACEPEGTGLRRVAQFPEYAVPEKDVFNLWEAATKNATPFPEALGLAASLGDISQEGKTGLSRLWNHLRPIVWRGDAWTLLTRYLFEQSEYLQPLLTGEGRAVRRNRLAIYHLLAYVQSVLNRLPEEIEERTQGAFLRHLRELIASGEDRNIRQPVIEGQEGVFILTMHASKGLEFPVVFLPNLTKRLFGQKGSSSLVKPPPSLVDSSTVLSEKESDAYLLFVGMSRARDHLIVSRPARWGGKNASPLDQNDPLQSALKMPGTLRVNWLRQQNGVDTQPTAEMLISEETHRIAPPKVDRENPGSPSVSASGLEQYSRCPRQFYYARVARLPVPANPDPAGDVFEAIRETTQWLQREWNQGETPSAAEARSRYEAEFERRQTGEETAQVGVLRERGALQIEPLIRLAPKPGTQLLPNVVTATLNEDRVSLHVDDFRELPDGRVQATRFLRGRPKSADHKRPRLGLMHLALREEYPGKDAEIRLLYLRDGSLMEVEVHPKEEAKARKEYETALQGISEASYPALPDPRKCCHCPFVFVCPT